MKYIFFLFLFSCAQHQVGSDAAGVLISKFSSLSKKDALRTALAQAKLQCDEERMIVESKKVVYEGKLSEEENEKIKEKTNKNGVNRSLIFNILLNKNSSKTKLFFLYKPEICFAVETANNFPSICLKIKF